jgi:DNA-binding CsgD family transcriptional regulator
MPSIPELKEREREILALLAEGKTARAIGARLNLAPETVRWYNKQIYAKLGVSSREDAVRRGTALGLIGASLANLAQSPVERSPIRYVDNDGVSIAYQVIGRGPVDLLFMTGFVSHIEAGWEDPGYTEFFEALGRHARVVTFDKRGVGLSDRVHGASTIENTISDARSVMQAAGSTRAFVSGTSETMRPPSSASIPRARAGLILIAATPIPATRYRTGMSTPGICSSSALPPSKRREAVGRRVSLPHAAAIRRSRHVSLDTRCPVLRR